MHKVLYAQAVFGQEEKDAVLKSLYSTMLSVGPLSEEFERQVAALFNKRYGVFVNSGSSANMIACSLLPKGDVITPALTFATTLAPIIQTGHKPVLVDCEVGTYLPTIDEIEKKITDKTVAVLIPNLLGNKMNAPRLRALCDKRRIIYIEDSCDTITESSGHVAITSFYGSHIITAMGGGGMIMTDDEVLSKRMRTIRDWGRGANESEAIDERYTQMVGKFLYDSKFLYVEKGFNFRPIEAQAAFGLEQLKRLPEFIKIRKDNFQQLYDFFKTFMVQYPIVVTQLPVSKYDPNWLAFPLLVEDRYDLVKWFEEHNIQTRPIFSGNITKHPAFKMPGKFPNADRVMEQGLLLGIHQGMGTAEIEYIKQTFNEYFSQLKNANTLHR